MKIGNNPIIYLTGKMWGYSKNTRKFIVLYFIMFVIANSIELLEPLLVAKILNTIQIEGVNEGNILRLIFYLLGFFYTYKLTNISQGSVELLLKSNDTYYQSNLIT